MNAALSTMITSPSWFRGRKIPSNRSFSSWQHLKLSVLWMKWAEKEIALGAPLARFQYDASDKDDNGKKIVTNSIQMVITILMIPKPLDFERAFLISEYHSNWNFWKYYIWWYSCWERWSWWWRYWGQVCLHEERQSVSAQLQQISQLAAAAVSLFRLLFLMKMIQSAHI